MASETVNRGVAPLRSHPIVTAAVLVVLSIAIPYMPASMLFAIAAAWVTIRWQAPMWARILVIAYTVVTALEFLVWLLMLGS